MKGFGETPLSDLKASDWVYDRVIVRVRDSVTVREALGEMLAASAACALVYRGSTLLGVMDTPDIVRHVLRATCLQTQSVARVLRPCVVASASLTIADVCAHMSGGTRYVAIEHTEGTERAHQLVSQRSLARRVFDALDASPRMRRVLESTTPDALPSFGRVITVHEDAPARAAFERMAAYSITSLPLVDAAGATRGVISATDVLYARHDATLLDANVVDFVTASRKDARNARDVECVVSCRPSDDMVIALRIMLHHRVHHVYVLDWDGRPLGVVSFVDILKLLQM